ncbi:Polysaccharide biosynthesis protein [Candidatus Thiomargarita nelsonii]|uniref:Polysaccharide biosynthesis protein n=1 Tax=Candidatus Thiomargarita nelsonii TaxID=1003181 RepID=A0A176RX38_9GAMM|nr:Polysaccharide biosynthesis protein [Candidatus Thiomargarita nelsonii]
MCVGADIAKIPFLFVCQIANFINVLFQNSYILIIGKLFSAEVTGLYFFANKIQELAATQITSSVQQATFPALASLQDDNTQLRQRYRRIIQIVSFIIAPIMLFLAVLAEPVFALLFEERWQGAVLYLQLLCLVGLFYPLHAMNVNILNVKGRSDLVLYVGIVKKLVNLGLLFAAIPYGVTGIIISRIIGSYFALLPNTYYSKRLIGYGLLEQVGDIAKPSLAALIAALVAWQITFFLADHHAIIQIAVVGTAAVALYVLLSKLIRAEGYSFLEGVLAPKLKRIFSNLK